MTTHSAPQRTLLAMLAAGSDDHPALVVPGRPPLTYWQLRANIAALAEQLNSLGLGRGDRIAIVRVCIASSLAIVWNIVLC